MFPQICSGNFHVDVGEDSASNVGTELDSEATSEAETIPGEIPFSPDVEMLISDNEVVENEVSDNEVIEIVDLISVISSEVEYLGEEFAHEDLTPEQEIARMRSEERWGFWTEFRLSNQQLTLESVRFAKKFSRLAIRPGVSDIWCCLKQFMVQQQF